MQGYFSIHKKHYLGFFRKNKVIGDFYMSNTIIIPVARFILNTSVLDGTDKLR